jgi:hypothetical protein
VQNSQCDEKDGKYFTTLDKPRKARYQQRLVFLFQLRVSALSFYDGFGPIGFDG